jgi:anti-sigma B factor antagonist
MNCIRTDNGGESRLVIDGSLDALTVRDLRPIIDAVVADRPQRVTVDIEKLELIDSSGVGAIVSLFKRVKANGGSVVVVGAREQPLAVLKLLKLDAVLGVT